LFPSLVDAFTDRCVFHRPSMLFIVHQCFSSWGRLIKRPHDERQRRSPTTTTKDGVLADHRDERQRCSLTSAMKGSGAR
jgi:hypothetical protein